jgi:hypothetical protein
MPLYATRLPSHRAGIEGELPFNAKYSMVDDADWETCASVLIVMSLK